jgi:hypothetical protein
VKEPPYNLVEAYKSLVMELADVKRERDEATTRRHGGQHRVGTAVHVRRNDDVRAPLAQAEEPVKLDLGATSDIPETWAPEPGAAQRRDAALDADARQGMPPPLPPAGNESEREAGEGLDAAVAEARERAGIDVYLEGMCPGCLAKVSER